MITYDECECEAAAICLAQASQLLYCEPNTETIAAQVREHMFEAAPYGMDNSQVRQGLALMASWCAEVEADLSDTARFDEHVAALKREWLRLFVGAGTPEAPCWESFYTEPNSQMFGERTLEVRAVYRRYGLQIEQLHHEPDDHLGLMCGFLSHVMSLEAQALADDDVPQVAAMRAEQEVFLVDHMLPWLSVWRYEVQKHASSDYYRGVGEFVFGLCECLASRFDIAFDEVSQAFKRTCVKDDVA